MIRVDRKPGTMVGSVIVATLLTGKKMRTMLMKYLSGDTGNQRMPVQVYPGPGLFSA
jgi:hypothetical protein